MCGEGGVTCLPSSMRLTFEVSESQESQLAALAQRLNVSVEQLPAAALRDLLERREATFDAAASYVSEKNGDLYRRLA